MEMSARRGHMVPQTEGGAPLTFDEHAGDGAGRLLVEGELLRRPGLLGARLLPRLGGRGGWPLQHQTLLMRVSDERRRQKGKYLAGVGGGGGGGVGGGGPEGGGCGGLGREGGGGWAGGEEGRGGVHGEAELVEAGEGGEELGPEPGEAEVGEEARVEGGAALVGCVAVEGAAARLGEGLRDHPLDEQIPGERGGVHLPSRLQLEPHILSRQLKGSGA